MSCERTANKNDEKQNKKVPFPFFDLDKNLSTKVNQLYKRPIKFVFAGSKKYCFPAKFKDVASDFYNFQIRSDDIWIFGFLRTGTTMTQELIWLIANDLNFEKASETNLDWRVPFFERDMFSVNIPDNPKYSADERQKILEAYPTFQSLIDTKERRFFKTHIPLSFVNPEVLTKGCKVIYTARNPKDLIVSNYLFSKSLNFYNYNIEVEEFWEYMRDDLYTYAPYFEHVKEGWANRHNKNVLFIHYEEITNDMRNTFKKVANFLEKPLTDEQLDKLEGHFKIDNFRNNKSVNNDHMRNLKIMQDKCDNFIRRGKIGGWKDYFTTKMNTEVDKWIEENLKGTDLRFYE